MDEMGGRKLEGDENVSVRRSEKINGNERKVTIGTLFEISHGYVINIAICCEGSYDSMVV